MSDFDRLMIDDPAQVPPVPRPTYVLRIDLDEFDIIKLVENGQEHEYDARKLRDALMRILKSCGIEGE